MSSSGAHKSTGASYYGECVGTPAHRAYTRALRAWRKGKRTSRRELCNLLVILSKNAWFIPISRAVERSLECPEAERAVALAATADILPLVLEIRAAAEAAAHFEKLRDNPPLTIEITPNKQK